MKHWVIILIAILSLASCVSTNEVRVDDSIIKYDYSIDQRFYAHPILSNPARVFVNSDTICAVVILEDGRDLPYSSWRSYRTIKGLLDEIAKYDTTFYIVRVTMDSVNHFPSDLYISEKPTNEISINASGGFITTNYIQKK
jgi:hypothetical protein